MKYEILMDEAFAKEFYGKKVHRIRALRDIPAHSVAKGDLGGYVMTAENLSQDGDCWVAEDAIVTENARVGDDAYVYGNAVVLGYAAVSGRSTMFGHSWAGGNASIAWFSKVYGNAHISDDARIAGHATIHGDAAVIGEADVCGHAEIMEKAVVSERAVVGSHAVLRGRSLTGGDARIMDEAVVCGHAIVSGQTLVTDSATVGGWSCVKGSAVVRDRAVVAFPDSKWYSHAVGGNTSVCGSTCVTNPDMLLTMELMGDFVTYNAEEQSFTCRRGTLCMYCGNREEFIRSFAEWHPKGDNAALVKAAADGLREMGRAVSRERPGKTEDSACNPE